MTTYGNFRARKSSWDDERWARRRRRQRVGVVAITLIVLIGAVIGISLMKSYYKSHERTIVVFDKERVCDGDGQGNTTCKYLIFTDTGTFELTDTFLKGRLNSSDVYGRIKRCHRYDITYYGWRSGWLSMYPNVDDVREDYGRAEGCET